MRYNNSYSNTYINYNPAWQRAIELIEYATGTPAYVDLEDYTKVEFEVRTLPDYIAHQIDNRLPQDLTILYIKVGTALKTFAQLRNQCRERLPDNKLLNLAMLKSSKDFVFITEYKGKTVICFREFLDVARHTAAYASTLLSAGPLLDYIQSKVMHEDWTIEDLNDMPSEVAVAVQQMKILETRRVMLENISRLNMFKVENEATVIRRQLLDLRDTIERKIQELNDRIADEHDLTKELLALEQAPDNMMSEFIDYLRTKRIDSVVSINHAAADAFIMTIKNKLHLDPEELADYTRGAATEGHVLHNKYPQRMFLEAIASGRIILEVAGTFQVRRSGNIVGTSYRSESIVDDILANPHINKYNCFTESKNYMTQYWRNRDMIGVLEQMLTTTGLINPYDSAVMNQFIRNIITFGSGVLCILDNTTMTITSAINKLKEEYNESHTHQQDNDGEATEELTIDF